jgi:hypothetical protein
MVMNEMEEFFQKMYISKHSSIECHKNKLHTIGIQFHPLESGHMEWQMMEK